MKIRSIVEDRIEAYKVDCGDNSCRFAFKKEGMRTNGGCRCTPDKRGPYSPIERLAILHTQLIRELVDEIERLEAKNGN